MKRTWKIEQWADRPQDTHDIALACPNCGNDAFVPMADPGALVIAAIGLNLIFDPPGHIPPPHFMPDTIKCRRCKHVFGSEQSDVR